MKFPHQPREAIEINDNVLVVYAWGSLDEETSPKVWENVELFDAQRRKVWTANGMEKCRVWNNHADTFVGTRQSSGRIQLTSFGGNSYDLDLRSGAVTFSEFHK